jgi:REP element-mobilizing transposase RayT
MTFLLTFNCYGTRLPGDKRGWVERARGINRGGYRGPSVALQAHARMLMSTSPYLLDLQRAECVLASIRSVSAFRSWDLLAAHVRTNHVHCVVGGVEFPNRAIADFKAYASRTLNQTEGPRKRWAREGSTRVLRTERAIRQAIDYVANGQGQYMAVYVCPNRDLSEFGLSVSSA